MAGIQLCSYPDIDFGSLCGLLVRRCGRVLSPARSCSARLGSRSLEDLGSATVTVDGSPEPASALPPPMVNSGLARFLRPSVVSKKHQPRRS
jgi:hypothetical protein